MDGYAVRSADGPGEVRVDDSARANCPSFSPVTRGGDVSQYSVASAVTAGQEPAAELQPGQVAYITTGAPVPPGADAVVKVWRRPDRGRPRAEVSAASAAPDSFSPPIFPPVAGGVDRGRWRRRRGPRASPHSARSGARAVDAGRGLRHRGGHAGAGPRDNAQRVGHRPAGHGATQPPRRVPLERVPDPCPCRPVCLSPLPSSWACLKSRSAGGRAWACCPLGTRSLMRAPPLAAPASSTATARCCCTQSGRRAAQPWTWVRGRRHVLWCTGSQWW